MFDRIHELQDLISPNLRYQIVTPTNLEALPMSEPNTKCSYLNHLTISSILPLHETSNFTDSATRVRNNLSGNIIMVLQW